MTEVAVQGYVPGESRSPMAMYDSDSWWQETFGVGKEDWFKNIAMNPSTDSAWMQGQLDGWYRAFTLRTGLAHPERSFMPHPAPKHPIEGLSVALRPQKLIVMGLKAGTIVGPILEATGTSMCAGVVSCPLGTTIAGVGTAYKVVGWGTVLADEFVMPLVQGDAQQLFGNSTIQLGEYALEKALPIGVKEFAPTVGLAADLSEAVCIGYNCK